MLGRLVTRWPHRFLAVAALLTILAGVVGAGAIDALSLSRYAAPGSDSAQARQTLEHQFDQGIANVALLVTAENGTVDSPAVAAQGRALTDELAADPDVRRAWSYWSTGGADTYRSADSTQAIVLAWVPGDANRVRRDVLPDLVDRLDRDRPGVEVVVGGGDEVFRQVADQSRSDFVRAELIIVPLILLLLWVVYRRLSAALLTLGVGVFATLGALALLRMVTSFADISTFAANIALVMGVGLGVDYGLFMTFRFREERERGHDTIEAVRRTVATAGRAVLFSGLTVAASVSVLLVFPFAFLSSFAYAGVSVVIAAVFGSVVLLPAGLVLLGDRVLRPDQPHRPVTDSPWYRLTDRVMRRPLVAGGAALVAVLLLASPVLGIRFGLPDDRMLPESFQVRGMYDDIRANFEVEDADALWVVAPDGDVERTGPYAAELSNVDGVARVDSAAGSFRDGRPVRAPDGTSFAGRAGATYLLVVPSSASLADDAASVVRDVRAVPAPYDVVVGGYPAELIDYRDQVSDRLPLVLTLIVIVTFVVLFLMTGSLIAPFKATVLNLLSLSVMLGALVFVFQNGAFADLLGFTPAGSIEPSIPLLMFCIAYGLSMDYEVFLLSRIKEEYDRTGDSRASVPLGIARSAPLVSAAALILGTSFAIYATGEVMILKELGVGMAVAILVDATLIRGVLVPAFMRLAGDANWWAPAPLRRLHRRIGISESLPEPHTAPKAGV